MRERMAQHRINPACSGCHQLMDPIGLSMEHFDAVGRWRNRSEGDTAIDASGALPSGAAFDGVAGLKRALLNRPEPSRSTRLLLDLKSGGAWPEHPEDMRLYALLYTLRFGVPPIRVATVFLSSGEWQAEEVSEDTLVHAADRVVRVARAAAELAEGREERLTAGPYRSWCPRRSACPAARERVATTR